MVQVFVIISPFIEWEAFIVLFVDRIMAISSLPPLLSRGAVRSFAMRPRCAAVAEGVVESSRLGPPSQTFSFLFLN